MRNDKEWFSANDLLGIGGLPNTPQGINKKARKNGWIRKNKDGVQGSAVEYHYSSLPIETQIALGFTPVQQNQFDLSTQDKLKEMEASMTALNEKIKSLEAPLPSSLPDYLNEDEKRLIRWFRLCDESRKIKLLAEVLADLAYIEQKESMQPLKDSKVA